MAAYTIPFDALMAKGHACIRPFEDQFIWQLHTGQDYHEFIRDSVMEAAHAIRTFCRRNDIVVNEVTVAGTNGATQREA
jgi:hypothetical protein